MERQKFEESFKEAFDGAEVAPSENVWANVELGLEKASGGKMKKRLLFFQLLAAASMVFAMGVGGIYYLNTTYVDSKTVSENQQEQSNPVQQENNEQDVATNQSASGTESADQSAKATTIENKRSETQATSSVSGTEKNNSASAGKEGVSTANQGPVVQNQNSSGPLDPLSQSGLSNRPLPRLVEVEQPVFKPSVPEPSGDPGQIMLAKLRDEEKKYQKKEKNVNEKLWTSLGMSAGTFDPNAAASAASSNSRAGAFVNTAASSNPTAGSSYSVGVSVAGKISDRLVLQAGISYLTQNAEYTSSSAEGMKAALNESAVTNDKITASNPYQVNSNLQYVSIPVQAGYIIVDQTFAIQVNGGISTDVFIQNTLTPDDKSLEKVTQKAGSDSPYRTLNFSGLVGTELSYKMGDHYRIALNPGLRYALTSIYKSEVSAQISPVTFDVALRFRYIIN